MNLTILTLSLVEDSRIEYDVRVLKSQDFKYEYAKQNLMLLKHTLDPSNSVNEYVLSLNWILEY
jgi:hypothetical protein